MTGLSPNLAAPIAAAGTAGDVDKLVKIFIGFKSSRQCIEEIVLLQDGVPTNYHDKYIVQEGFVDAALRPWASKHRHRFVETLYENVVQYMPDVCGTYVNAADFPDGLIHEVVFDVNIPVNNLLAFQLFDKWLKEWGELALQLYFAHTKQSFVVAYCSPYEVLEQKQFLQTDVVANPTLAGDVMKYKHAYTQIDDPFIGITNVVSTATKAGDVLTVGTATFTVGQVIIKQHGGVATEFTSTIRGFDIHEFVRDNINAKIIQRPLVIPSQEFPNPMPFPLPPNDGGISTNLNMSYQNCYVSYVCSLRPTTRPQSWKIRCSENFN
jgi:hypothetical protein